MAYFFTKMGITCKRMLYLCGFARSLKYHLAKLLRISDHSV